MIGGHLKPEKIMKQFVFGLLVMAFCVNGFGAGSVSVTTELIMGSYVTGVDQRGRKVSVSFIADATNGSLPDTVLYLNGLVVKVVTNPGSTAPTDNYDIDCGDPSDTALDIFGGALANRDTTTTEQAYPVITGATIPVVATTCTLSITNNSVNSATGVIDFYVVRP